MGRWWFRYLYNIYSTKYRGTTTQTTHRLEANIKYSGDDDDDTDAECRTISWQEGKGEGAVRNTDKDTQSINSRTDDDDDDVPIHDLDVCQEQF